MFNRICVALATLLLCVTSLFSATVKLPYANEDGEILKGYVTTLVVNNPTSEEVRLDHLNDGTGIGSLPPRVPAYSTFRQSHWPKPGGNVTDVTVPDGCVAYVEVSDPYGQITRVQPFGAGLPPGGGALLLQDLRTDPPFVSYVFVFSDGVADVDLTTAWKGEDVRTLQTGVSPTKTVAIEKLGAGVDTVKVTHSRIEHANAGNVYAFAIISHSPDGEMLTVQSTPINAPAR